MTARKPETKPEVRTENVAAPIELARRAPLEFTDDQRKMIRETYAAGTDDSTFAVLMEIARLRRLNPITGQCHFVSRPHNFGTDDSPRWGKKWSVQVAIDGFRAKAEEHPAYDGQSEKVFTYSTDGRQLISCRVEVYRKDRKHPFVATCYYDEYVQTKKNGEPVKMWLTKRHIMLGKCTEAAALRMAFPDELGGLYTEDEMPPEEKEINPMPPKQEKKAPAAPEDAQVIPPAGATAGEADPKKATPEEKLEHLRETIKVATDPAELRLCWTDAKGLPPEMFEQVKQLCFARNAELDMIASKGPLAKSREHTVTQDPAAARTPGQEG